MTRDNVAPAGLLEKEWFPLDEVAKRWSGLFGREITVHDLLHLGGQDKVEICGFRRNNERHSIRYTQGHDEPLSESRKFDDDGGAYWFAAPIESIFDMADFPLMAIIPEDIRQIEQYGKAHVWEGLVGRFFYTAEDDGVTYTPADLYITKRERNRFETENLHQVGMVASGELGESVDLVEPARSDDWAKCIIDAAREYRNQNGTWPKDYQLWAMLRGDPPQRFGVERCSDRGEDALSLAGEKPLDREAFGKRYRRYFRPVSDQ
ncbi:hypothetical protein GM160_06060 [Guyparkeria halophila]|uniref:Uncharacterized protein n=1 Tax=Guyparkeria halophila TaxID=47960 RepID=A0A6I6D2U5_9GAMM|nr:hypothetical protein [Guyparkeria halophila]QGT78497.1 hypothetical protein GM160_06060 [Guyparkeria halophila]